MSANRTNTPLFITADPNVADRAKEFALVNNYAYLPKDQIPEPTESNYYLLFFGTERIELVSHRTQGPGPVFVEWQTGPSAHRRKYGGGRGQQIAKAVGLKPGIKSLSVMDATAGLGGDSFVLASLGCSVTLFERNPIIACLLQDGMARASMSDDHGLRKIVSRMQFQPETAYFADACDVVYLDPMFPTRSKTSLVKKQMQVFHDIVGFDEAGDDLLVSALHADAKRVVVKRPRISPYLAGLKPTFQVVGKSSRFDVYAKQSL